MWKTIPEAAKFYKQKDKNTNLNENKIRKLVKEGKFTTTKIRHKTLINVNNFNERGVKWK